MFVYSVKYSDSFCASFVKEKVTMTFPTIWQIPTLSGRIAAHWQTELIDTHEVLGTEW
jgi:hypothetical protein